MGLAVPSHMEFSQTRDRTHVACIARQILNHWTTREVPRLCLSTDALLRSGFFLTQGILPSLVLINCAF